MRFGTPERTRAKKTQKVDLRTPRRTWGVDFGAGLGPILGSGQDPKIDLKRARGRKSAFGDGAGSVFLRFLVPLLFGVSLWTDFWRV